jgi:hypothetical protein
MNVWKITSVKIKISAGIQMQFTKKKTRKSVFNFTAKMLGIHLVGVKFMIQLKNVTPKKLENVELVTIQFREHHGLQKEY